MKKSKSNMKKLFNKLKKGFSFNLFFLINWIILICVVVPLCGRCENTQEDYGEDLTINF